MNGLFLALLVLLFIVHSSFFIAIVNIQCYYNIAVGLILRCSGCSAAPRVGTGAEGPTILVGARSRFCVAGQVEPGLTGARGRLGRWAPKSGVPCWGARRCKISGAQQRRDLKLTL